METQIITDTLKKEYIHRCQRNERYSLRAYARYLNVDHSLLTKILRGQKLLSKKMAFQVGNKLGLSSTQVQNLFEQSSEATTSRQVDEDVYVMMSDWYHFAILELAKIKGFACSIKKVAKSLGISTLETEQAFERLQRLGFLKIKNNQEIEIIRQNNNWFNYEKTSDARKVMQKQFLKKALEAVDHVDFPKRVNSSLTIAIGSKDLQKYKKLIQKFIDDIDGISTAKLKKDDVYQLCIAFYPLTKKDLL